MEVASRMPRAPLCRSRGHRRWALLVHARRQEVTAMSTAMQRWRMGIQRTTRRLGWLPLLVTRLCLGGLFVSTGWGKIHNLAKVSGFFTELGIPQPGLTAPLVGYSELICGALLI